MTKTIMALLVAALALSGCASTRQQTVVTTAPRAPVVAPQPMAVNMLPVEWKVINKSELEALLVELNANPDPKFTLMALTPKGFENLALNMEELKRFMREQNEVIIYYKQVVAE